MSEYSLWNDSAGSLWYYRSLGQVTGPLTSGRIRQLAKQGKLFPEDQVRLGAAGDWVAAEDVEGLFSGIALNSRAERAAVRAQAANEHKEQDSAPVSATWYRGDILRGRIADGVEWGRNNLELLRVGFSWLCLVTVLISLGAIFARRVSMDWWSRNADPYETLTLARHEFQRLRDSQADEEQWTRLAARTRPEFAPLIANLEKKAGADDRYSQQLLWAARDAWPPMLTSSRQEPNDAEHAFESHLANARILKNGGQLFPGAQRIGGAAGFDSDIFMGLYGDWVVAGFVVGDAFLAIAAVRWWWRRSR